MFSVRNNNTLSFVIGARVRALKSLAHEVFVGARHAWPLYVEAKETCRKVAGSADTFNNIMEQLELARLGDEQAWRKAIEYLCPKAHAELQAFHERRSLLKKTIRGTFPHRPDILYHAHKSVDSIARKGGKEFDEVINLIKFARADAKAGVQLMELLFPDEAKV